MTEQQTSPAPPQFCMVLVHDAVCELAFGPFRGAVDAVEWASAKCAPRSWRLIYAYVPDDCEPVEVSDAASTD